MSTVDAHQHLWPEPLTAELTRRRAPPLLRRSGRGWTVRPIDEPECRFDPVDHDPRVRVDLLERDGLDRALVAMSSALGIEILRRPSRRLTHATAGCWSSIPGSESGTARHRVFAVLAGGAPLHVERLGARGGPTAAGADPGPFDDTSSYGARTIDAVVRTVGVHQVVYGSDRTVVDPPPATLLGQAARGGDGRHQRRATARRPAAVAA